MREIVLSFGVAREDALQNVFRHKGCFAHFATEAHDAWFVQEQAADRPDGNVETLGDFEEGVALRDGWCHEATLPPFRST